jgi:hypothetical protein
VRCGRRRASLEEGKTRGVDVGRNRKSGGSRLEFVFVEQVSSRRGVAAEPTWTCATYSVGVEYPCCAANHWSPWDVFTAAVARRQDCVSHKRC